MLEDGADGGFGEAEGVVIIEDPFEGYGLCDGAAGC